MVINGNPEGRFMPFKIKEETLDSLFACYETVGQKLNWSSVFTLPVWLKSWWEIFGKDYQLCLHSVWLDEELIGIAPLMRRGSEACLIGSPDVCDYLDFITIPGKEKEFLQGLLPELKMLGIERLELSAQRPDAVMFKGYFIGTADFGCVCRGQFAPEDQSFELKLYSTWEDYLAGFAKKERHEIRRKLRRLKNEVKDYRYRVIEESGEVEDFTAYFLDLFKQNPEKDNFLTEKMERFFHMLIGNMARADLARFGLLEIDGSVAAAVLYFDYRDRIYLYNSGYIADYGSLSVGLLSKIFCIRDSIERGRQVFDFLKGQEVYKSRLGGTAIPIYKVQITIN